MKAPVLVLLLAIVPLALAAAVPPDLADAARQIEQLAATRGQESESARLARFFDLYWTARMRAFPTLATYVGYPGLGDRWPDLSPATFAFLYRLAHLELATLDSIDRSQLGAAAQVDYDLARRRLTLGIEGERLAAAAPLQGEVLVLDQLNGIDEELPSLLSAMPGRNAGDYEIMLRRMRGFPAAVDQVLALLAQGLAAGITPPRVTLRDVPARVSDLLTGDPDPGKNPILERFQKLPETIPEADRERLRQEARRIFKEEVTPALRRLHDYLLRTYVPGARETIAMSDLPNGRAWYAFALKSFTTTDLGPEAIHRLGLSEVGRIRKEMDALIASTGFQGSFADFCRFLRTDPRFFYDRPEDLVAAYRDITKRIDPELVQLFSRLPRLPYGVKAMDGGGAKSAPVAYYSSGSLAAGLPGWLLVNTYDLKSRPKWEMETIALHETVPGHHMMYGLAEELENLPEWRKWDVYPAFSEGWGLYAESLGSAVGLYRDPYSRFGRLSNEIVRAIRMVVDTGIHAEGWTRQRAIDYYRANSAKPEHDIEVEVDRIIVQPGTVPCYKLGELKIRELRTFAEKELGTRFDLRAFHDHLLGHGQLPLDLLEKSVKEWVAGVKRGDGTGSF